MEWGADAIETLRALWAEGLSTAEIGRRMGVSKNAVIGKAHRLNLPARPSPIRRDGAAGPRPATPRPIVARPIAPRPVRPATPPSAPPPAPPPAPRPAPPRHVSRAGVRTCCWPIGEPGTRGFHFCGREALPGKPYCAEHAAVAYVKVRDRREDAA
jgi:GcrA cell cycle regulator